MKAVFSLALVSGLHAFQDVPDACAAWLVEDFVGGQCDAKARDTIEQFNSAGRGYLSGMDPCSCDATALFLNYYFASVARNAAQYGQPMTNESFATFQQHFGVLTFDHLTWPFTDCEPAQAVETQKRTVEELRCILGLSEGCRAHQALARRAVTFYLRSASLGTGHTFVIQHADAEEYYLWQGFIGAYDLHSWVKQDPHAGRNYSGGSSRFAGRLGSKQVAEFVDKLAMLVAGERVWEEVAPLWSELFWVEAPRPEGTTRCANVSSSSPIRIGLTYWTQDYSPENCEQSRHSYNVSWNKDHEAWRQTICKRQPGVAKCSGAQGSYLLV